LPPAEMKIQFLAGFLFIRRQNGGILANGGRHPQKPEIDHV
jgi:hypothetical protein